MAGPQPAPDLSDFPMVVDKDKGSIEVKVLRNHLGSRILKRKEVVNEEANVADVDTSSTWHQQEESSSLVNEVVGLVAIPEEDEVTDGREVDKVGRDEERVGSEEIRENVLMCHLQSRDLPSKKNGDSSVISSLSRFAILSEDQEESGNTLQEEDKESEEGEIVEDQTNESFEDRSRKKKQKQEVVDGMTRRTSTRHSKGLTKSVAENKTQGLEDKFLKKEVKDALARRER
ncbi:hypothetical protein F2Q69_00037397 [Brassica cretica]|uniref:Uncharacterized protein n=1 Tax=Brassica cretica TaxID=69181 RepID=A0A8S9SW99_BRACR|nr:hypothetical protein F2Q69_00037397 [Brassica cretica]